MAPHSSHDSPASPPRPSLKRPRAVLPESHSEPNLKRMAPSSRAQILRSPTHHSTIQVNSLHPFEQASIVHKVSRTSIKNGMETTLYTISVTRALPTSSPSTENHPPSRTPLDELRQIARAELKKPTGTVSASSRPRPALQSVENHVGTQFRLKTVPAKSTTQQVSTSDPPVTSSSVKRFSYVFH